MDEKIPDEFEIGELFSQIKPTPNPGFHKKMVHQPWNKLKQKPFWFEFSRTQTIATISIVSLLIIGIAFVSPNLNTLARQLTQFFSPTMSNQVGEAIKSLETRQIEERFTLSIIDAEKLAGFKLKRITAPLNKFSFVGATYDELRGAIILQYTANSGGLVLRFSQQLLDPDYQGIDPKAVVEKVTIGKYNGEYVAGGWSISEVESDDDPKFNENTSNAYWDPNVKLQTLRWTDGIYLFEIILAGGRDQIDYLDKQGLVELAKHLD